MVYVNYLYEHNMGSNKRQQGEKKLRSKLFSQTAMSEDVFNELCDKTSIAQSFDLKTCINAIERLFLTDNKLSEQGLTALGRFVTMLEENTSIPKHTRKDAINAIHEYISSPELTKFYAYTYTKTDMFNQLELRSQLDLLSDLPMTQFKISDNRFEAIKLTIATSPLLSYLSPKAMSIRQMMQTELTQAFDIHDTRFEIQRQSVIQVINQTTTSLSLQEAFDQIKQHIPTQQEFENDEEAAKKRAINCFVFSSENSDIHLNTLKEKCLTTITYIDKLATQLNVNHITYVKDILPKIVQFMADKNKVHMLAQGFHDSFYAYDKPGAFHEDTSSCLSGVETRLIFCVWPYTNPTSNISYESSIQTWLSSQTQYFLSAQQPTPLLWSLMLEAFLDLYELKLDQDYNVVPQLSMPDETPEEPSAKTLAHHTLFRVESYLGSKNRHLYNVIMQDKKLQLIFQEPHVREMLQDILESGEVTASHRHYFMNADGIIERFKEFIINDRDQFKLTIDAWKQSPYAILSKINNHQVVHYKQLKGHMSAINYMSRDVIDDVIGDIWSASDLAEALYTAIRCDLDDYTDLLIQKGAHFAMQELFDISVIILACQSQNISLLRHLATYPLDFNFKRDTDGMTALMYAARYFPEAVPLLTELQVDLNLQDYSGNTALHHAIIGSQHQSLKTLLENDADTQVKNKKQESPLHTAAHLTDWKCIDSLLQYDADPTIRDHEMRNFAHILLAKRAYHTGLEEVIINHKLNRFDKNQNCLLYYALEQKHYDLCQALIEQGLSLYHPQPNHSCIDFIIRERKLPYIEHILYHNNLPHKFTLTKIMLFDAIRYHNRRYYKLISKEVDILKMHLHNKTALQYAYSQKFMLAVQELIIKSTPDYLNITHATTPSLLYMAVSESDEPIVRACIKAGASVDVLYDKKHMLSIAITNCDLKITKRLLSQPHNQSWYSLLPALIKACNAKITKDVYTHFAPLNNNNNLLHALIHAKAETLISTCIPSCRNMINEQDKDGRTPLILAVQKQLAHTVSILMNNDADVDITDKHHHTAEHYAHQSPNHVIRDLFDNTSITHII